jgi:hypothetical protein
VSEQEHPDPAKWWFHRRVMAYISLACLLSILIALLTDNVATGVLPLAQTLAWVFSANLLYYYGGNAAEAMKGK